MRVSVDDKFRPKLEAIATDLGIQPNKVVELVLRQYLPIFEAHMAPETPLQIPPKSINLFRTANTDRRTFGAYRIWGILDGHGGNIASNKID